MFLQALVSNVHVFCVLQDGFWMANIFNGYNAITLLLVANLAFSGLLVSWVMKFADSIMKVRHHIAFPWKILARATNVLAG